MMCDWDDGEIEPELTDYGDIEYDWDWDDMCGQYDLPERQYDFRTDPKSTPLQAIKRHCRGCAGFRDCDVFGCEFWPYHRGHNPARKGIGGDKTFGTRMAAERARKKQAT